MKILVERKLMLLLAVGAVSAAIVPAAIGYTALVEAVGLSAIEAKTAGEGLLFVGITAAGLFLLLLLTVLLRVYRVSTALARIAELHRMDGYDLRPALLRLGDIGESILQILGQLTELNRRKSTRMHAMNGLLQDVLSKSGKRILVVDPRGMVIRATPAALELLDRPASAVLDLPVDDALPGTGFARTRAAIGRSGDPWTVKGAPFPLAVEPIPDDRGETGYYVYYLGPDASLVHQSLPDSHQITAAPQEPPTVPPAVPTAHRQKSLLSRLRKLLG